MHYERKLQTKAGEVSLRIPKLRTQTFETAIIERYRRRESSVEEALIEMYLAGVSVRRVEDITEALWGPAGLKDVVFGVLLTPVAPKLLRDRADDGLSVGRLPRCCHECCSRDNLHHRLSPFLDQAAFLHFGAVAASQSSSSCPCSTTRSAVDTFRQGSGR